jgi:hypothetical protein
LERDKVLDLLDAQDWPDIIRRLTYYAISRAKIYSWNFGNSDELPAGKTPEDIACSAIEKVWSETRAWNPEKYPDLFQHLKWIVKSDIGHLFSSSEHKLRKRESEDNDTLNPTNDYDETCHDTSLVTEGSANIYSAEEKLIIQEEKELEERLKEKLYELVKGDDDLEMLLLFFEDGIDKPETIALEMNWDINKVYNLKRKLFRKASKVYKTSTVGKRTKEKGREERI